MSFLFKLEKWQHTSFAHSNYINCYVKHDVYSKYMYAYRILIENIVNYTVK